MADTDTSMFSSWNPQRFFLKKRERAMRIHPVAKMRETAPDGTKTTK